MADFDALARDPKFRALSYDDQVAVRTHLFERDVMSDARFKALAPTDQQAVYTYRVNAAPAYESADAQAWDFTKRAQGVVARMASGDKGAVDEAVTDVVLRNTAKSSLIATVAGLGVQAVAELFDPSRPHGEVTKGYFGKDSQKTVDWLNANIARYGGAGAAASAQGWSTAGSIGASLIEMLVGGMGLIGTAEKGGVLTAKLFGEGGKLSKMIAGISSSPVHNLMKSQLPGLAESAAYGIFATTQNAARDALQGELGDPTKLEFYGAMARDLGVETATNYIGWGIMRGLGTLLHAQVKTARGFKTPPVEVTPETVADAVRTSFDSSGALKVAGKDIKGKFVASEARLRVREFDPKDRATFAAWGESNGFNVTYKGERVSLEPIFGNPSPAFHGLTQAEASAKLAEMHVTGQVSAKAPVASAVKDLSATATETNALKTRLEGTLSPDVASEQLIPLITPVRGVMNEANVKVAARALMRERGMADEAIAHVTIRLDDAARPSKFTSDIVLPRTVASLTDERAFTKALVDGIDRAAKVSGVEATEASVKRATDFLDSLGRRKSLGGATTPEALDFVAKSRLGVALRDAKTGGFDIVDLQGTVVGHFDDLASATRGIYGKLVDQGQVSVAHLNSVVTSRTGLRIEAYEKPLVAEGSAARKQVKGDVPSVTSYRLLAPMQRADRTWTEKSLGESESLVDLLAAHPEIDPRLPSSLAPRTYVISDKAGATTEVAVEQSLVAGSHAKLLEFANGFDNTGAEEVLASFNGSKIVANGKMSVELVNDVLGTRTTFTGETAASAFASAKRALTRRVDAWSETVDAFAMKGYKAATLGDGTVAAVGPHGVEATFSSLDEMRAWLARTPEPAWIGDIMGADFASAGVLDAEIAEAAKSARGTPRTAIGRGLQKVWSYASTFFAPSGMSMYERAIATGDSTLSRMWFQMRNAMRIVDGAQARLGQLRAKVYEGANDVMLTKIAAATTWPEATRATRWRLLFKEEMPAVAKSVIDKQRIYYDGLFRAYGLDPHKYVAEYLPTIKKFLIDPANANFLVDTNSATTLVKSAFRGGMPREFEVFAERMRSTDIARMALMDNALEVAEAYSHAILRAKYLNPMIESLRTEMSKATVGTMVKKFDKEFFEDTISLLKSAPRSRTDSMLAELSRGVAAKFTDTVKKTPILRKLIDPNASPDDVMEILNYRMTLATQATKPWAPLRNFMQITNISIVFDSSTPWRIAKQFIRDDAAFEAVVRRMTRSGAVSERLPGESIRADRNVWQRTMRWNENMDVYTRAIAWRAAEERFDDVALRLRKGTIDMQSAAREMRLGMLNGPESETVLGALKAGADDVGRDAYANAFQSLTMYDYAKLSKPMMARGFMGKLFGKFMTYPASTVALYGRILTQSRGVDKLGMIARLAANTSAVYYAFKEMGVDYQGFQWSEPFSFQGGPLWSLLVDGTAILGTDAEAKAARSSILKQLPRLMSPTYAFATQITRAFSYLDKGDTQGALATLGGAPASKMLVGSNLLGLGGTLRDRP